MADNENTTPAGVLEVAAELNGILAKFIKGNGKAVRYFRTEDGYSFITLEYGKCRVPEMEKIKEFINNSVYDNCLKIDNMPVTCVRMSDTVMIFKGKTEEVETYISQNASSEVLTNIVAKAQVASTEEKEQILSLDDDIASVLESLVSERSTFSSDALKKAGVAFDEYDGVGHISFDIKKINDYVALGETAKDYEQIFDVYTLITKLTFYKANFARDFEKFIQNSSFDSELKAKITLLTDSKLVIGYAITKYDEFKKTESGSDSKPDDFTYEKTPGYLSRVIVHYGNPTFSALKASDVTVTTKTVTENGFSAEIMFMSDKSGNFIAAAVKTDDEEILETYRDIDYAVYRNEESFINDFVVSNNRFFRVKTNKKVILNITRDGDAPNNGTDIEEGFSESNDDYPQYAITEALLTNAKIKDFMINLVKETNSSLIKDDDNIDITDISNRMFDEYSNSLPILHIGTDSGIVFDAWSNDRYPNQSFCGVCIQSTDKTTVENAEQYTKDFILNNSGINSNYYTEFSASYIRYSKNIIATAVAAGRAIDIYIYNK